MAITRYPMQFALTLALAFTVTPGALHAKTEEPHGAKPAKPTAKAPAPKPVRQTYDFHGTIFTPIPGGYRSSAGVTYQYQGPHDYLQTDTGRHCNPCYGLS